MSKTKNYTLEKEKMKNLKSNLFREFYCSINNKKMLVFFIDNSFIVSKEIIGYTYNLYIIAIFYNTRSNIWKVRSKYLTHGILRQLLFPFQNFWYKNYLWKELELQVQFNTKILIKLSSRYKLYRQKSIDWIIFLFIRLKK